MLHLSLRAMQAERSERLAEVVASALECAPAERAQFLRDVCGNDMSLREEAESLLHFEKKARDFLETPAYELAAQKVFDEAGELPVASAAEDSKIISTGSPVLAPEKTFRDRTSKFIRGNWIAMLAAILAILVATKALVIARREMAIARRQRDLAQIEQRKAERVSSFLQRTLLFSNASVISVWPVARNKNVAVIELLDQIIPQVEKEFADDGEIRGQLLGTIGRAYAAHGHYDSAERNLRLALKTQTTFQGQDNPRVAETLIELGILSYRQAKLDEASAFLEKAVAFYRKKRQAKLPDYNAAKLALALDYLGLAKLDLGETKAGRAILEEALRIVSEVQPRGPDRSAFGAIKTDLGGAFVMLGDFKKAEPLLRESLAESRETPDRPQWELGLIMQMRGELALAKNQPSEAEKNLSVAEQIYRDTLGEKNLFFARNLNKRAAVSLLQNDLKSAEELARRSLALAQECSPANKVPWMDPMLTLSEVAIQDGRAREGEDYLREAIRICEERPTRNYVAISAMKLRLSQLLLAQKRVTEAENLAFEAHSDARQHLEEQNPTRKATANNLIQIYEREGKREAAQRVK